MLKIILVTLYLHPNGSVTEGKTWDFGKATELNMRICQQKAMVKEIIDPVYPKPFIAVKYMCRAEMINHA